jgi:Family of unknown function (DUF5681)
MSDENDDAVGYGKPPKSTQFRKGVSGNPKGRPKGSRNFTTRFRELALEKVTVKENGRTKTMTRIDAVSLQIITNAMRGDIRAAKEAFNRFQQSENLEQASGSSRPDMEKDLRALNSFLERQKGFRTSEEVSAASSTRLLKQTEKTNATD